MGLEQYVYVSGKNIKEDVDFEINRGDEQLYWWGREYIDLLSWMDELYYKKGGKYRQGFVFSGKGLILTREDILNLQLDGSYETEWQDGDGRYIKGDDFVILLWEQ